jgi:hypothetical protein
MLGHLHVVGGVVGQPDDPRMILRLAAHVPQLELLYPEHLPALAPREPVGRRAPEPAEAENDVLEVQLHDGLGRVSSAPVSPSFSPT